MYYHLLFCTLFFFFTQSCKPTSEVSDLSAIVSEDQKNAFAIVPTRHAVNLAQVEKNQNTLATYQQLQSLALTTVGCQGPNAKYDIKIVENAYVELGEAVKRSGSKLHFFDGKNAADIKNCRIVGGHSMGAPSLARLLTGKPSLAAQAVYLALRGPTVYNNQTVGAGFYSFVTESFRLRFRDVSQYKKLSRDLDRLFNPCIVEKASYDKNSHFKCTEEGNYQPTKQSYRQILNLVIAESKRSLDAHLARTKDSFLQSAYTQYIKNTPITTSVNAANMQALSDYFSEGRELLVQKWGLLKEDRPASYETSTSAFQRKSPDDRSPSWRKMPSGVFTEDGIAFYEKIASGQWNRTVITQNYRVLNPVQSPKTKVRHYSLSQTSAGLSLTNDKRKKTTQPAAKEGLPNNPNGRQEWIAEQGPVMEDIVEKYRNGSIDGQQFRKRFSDVTKHMPYGQGQWDAAVETHPDLQGKWQTNELSGDEIKAELEKRGTPMDSFPSDPWRKDHNCTNVSASVCRSMFPIMPGGTSLGRISIHNGNGGFMDDNLEHSINYFKVGKQYVVYDQQSGAMSTPKNSIKLGLKDDMFRSRMMTSYGYSSKGPTLSPNSGMRRWVNGTKNSSIQPFTPWTPNYHHQGGWDQPDDGSRGNYNPDKMGWYKPNQ